MTTKKTKEITISLPVMTTGKWVGVVLAALCASALVGSAAYLQTGWVSWVLVLAAGIVGLLELVDVFYDSSTTDTSLSRQSGLYVGTMSQAELDAAILALNNLQSLDPSTLSEADAKARLSALKALGLQINASIEAGKEVPETLAQPRSKTDLLGTIIERAKTPLVTAVALLLFLPLTLSKPQAIAPPGPGVTDVSKLDETDPGFIAWAKTKGWLKKSADAGSSTAKVTGDAPKEATEVPDDLAKKVTLSKDKKSLSVPKVTDVTWCVLAKNLPTNGRLVKLTKGKTNGWTVTEAAGTITVVSDTALEDVKVYQVFKDGTSSNAKDVVPQS